MYEPAIHIAGAEKGSHPSVLRTGKEFPKFPSSVPTQLPASQGVFYGRANIPFS